MDEVRRFALSTPSRGYTGSEVKVDVGQVVPVDPSTVRVEANEVTKLYFGHGDPTAPAYEAYRLVHDFTFAKQANGSWALTDTAPRLDSGPPPPTQSAAPKGSGRAATAPSTSDDSLPAAGTATAEEAGASPAPKTAATFGKNSSPGVQNVYNYQAMYDYAYAHWDSYNGAYRTFGNDCTNFISQIVEAGGWTYIEGLYTSYDNWWYNWINNTHTWAGAHNWGVFAQLRSHRTTALAQMYQVLTTDIVQVNWDHPAEDPDEEPNNLDHSMVVTGILGQAGAAQEVYLTYHSNNRLNVPFWGQLLPQSNPEDTWHAHRT